MINSITNNSESPRAIEALNAKLTSQGKITAERYIKNIEIENAQNSSLIRETKNSKEELKVDEAPKVDYKELEREIQNIIKENQIAIEFAIDNDSKKMIMKIIDEETQEIVKQFPSEISLQIAKLLTKSLDSGQITNAKV